MCTGASAGARASERPEDFERARQLLGAPMVVGNRTIPFIADTCALRGEEGWLPRLEHRLWREIVPALAVEHGGATAALELRGPCPMSGC